jgi:hypothetical protein
LEVVVGEVKMDIVVKKESVKRTKKIASLIVSVGVESVVVIEVGMNTAVGLQ